MTQRDESDSRHVRLSLRWDDIILSDQVVTGDNDLLDLARWKRVDIRLDPRWVHQTLTIYESTLFVLTFEKADAAGRRVTR